MLSKFLHQRSKDVCFFLPSLHVWTTANQLTYIAAVALCRRSWLSPHCRHDRNTSALAKFGLEWFRWRAWFTGP
jgi:hypothetical protein